MLSNARNSFENLCAIGTGLSDFHKMTAKVTKMKSEKLKQRRVHYSDYKAFSNDTFREYVLSKFSIENILSIVFKSFLEYALVLWTSLLHARNNLFGEITCLSVIEILRKPI